MTAHAPEPTVRTTCAYCGVGCGVLATPDGQGGAAIAGDPDHPANFGRLCSKGSALGETLGLEDRLLHPMLDGRRASWEEALGAVAGGLRRTIERHGPDSVAFYLSGQLLTEDYYVANKLAKGFIGTPHVDTNSRLCMSSAVAAHRRAFGSDTVPGCYEDLDEADLIVLVGSNTAWCHPILYRRMTDARTKRGTRLVVIDPRRTQTAEEADLFLPLAPGSDSALFSGLLVHLADTGTLDAGFIERSTSGLDAALDRARSIAPNLAAVAALTGLDEARIAEFYAMFADTERVVTAFSQGANQSAQGTDKGNAIINCHLATGRIGTPGAGPLSLTGQPNAMGGREVGGLANMLAAHMHFTPEEVDRVRRFWKAPNIITGEGMKAVALFEAIETGRIKALWVIGTNPLVSMPRAERIRAAIETLDLYVVSEVVADSDTAAARGKRTVLLPALGWGEKDGTVTNTERRISRQRGFLTAPGEARADWAILSDVARRLGHGEAFPYTSAAAIFREHAALSAFENEGTRDFDIGGLADIGDRAYDVSAPVQWPVTRKGGTVSTRKRLFADGRFFTFDGRARFVAVQRPALAEPATPQRPLVLNTGRVRDHWHTMTRTGRSQRLAAHRSVPFLEIHPDDAAAAGLTDGGIARLSSAHGEAELEVAVTDAALPGNPFMPMHWSDATASRAFVGALAQGANDPVSGQPELKATPAAVTPVPYRSRGFLLTRSKRSLPEGWWWARATVVGGSALQFATNDGSREIALMMRGLFQGMELAEYADHARGRYRCAVYDGEHLVACLALGPAEARPDWEAAKALFALDAPDAAARRALLTGRAASAAGPTVCACHGVGLDAITACIAGGAGSVEAVGAACKAGTNCGSCIPEIRKLLPAALARSAA
ncbi:MULTISPECIES: nitrate reductase [Methylobacterium]|uniref:Nitrate reductase n=7 Tax=Pseudomonadota TaxID=1224 RepID=A0ABQ4SQY3_9HYPH|nr:MULTISPECIES: nitrate reductase [Methylobacterium]PIU04747.1 MAG: nitrate reductase [Methylobacterium sp. CG09_land_8_20_14_0_10_71_15]PIU13449.1 MAG: nitrate reductase [Methylobacterium sp. CG08_land_8_20_14_0_20_71_15]GBU17667.1 periplasmic nitrate reductase NapA [Methylobacterium sp.]GJE04843.1 Nitrate reductase [Methylobacterium jeotgali]